jgi:hypothetical protein
MPVVMKLELFTAAAALMGLTFACETAQGADSTHPIKPGEETSHEAAPGLPNGQPAPSLTDASWQQTLEDAFDRANAVELRLRTGQMAPGSVSPGETGDKNTKAQETAANPPPQDASSLSFNLDPADRTFSPTVKAVRCTVRVCCWIGALLGLVRLTQVSLRLGESEPPLFPFGMGRKHHHQAGHH